MQILPLGAFIAHIRGVPNQKVHCPGEKTLLIDRKKAPLLQFLEKKLHGLARNIWMEITGIGHRPKPVHPVVDEHPVQNGDAPGAEHAGEDEH